MNNPEAYKTTHDFLNDNSFLEWQLSGKDSLDSYWMDFIRANPHKRAVFDEAVSRFETLSFNTPDLSEESEKAIYRKIIYKVKLYKRKQQLINFGLSIASLVFLGLLLTVYITHSKKKHITDSFISSHEAILGKKNPSKAIQLITGSKVLNLNQNTKIVLSHVGDALVTDSFHINHVINLSQETLNKLIVPYGKRAHILLSDGTQVWLNSGTKIEFPSKFSAKKREIYVSGEIFLHVAKKKDVPFFVYTKKGNVQVLGTQFNISAYPDDEQECIVLVEGSVRINVDANRFIFLNPNEKATIENNEIAKAKVNVSRYISWTKGIMELDETPISEILKKIGRYYDVDFELSIDFLQDKTCSGKLYLYNDLDSVMNSISVLSSTMYKRENNIIRVNKQKK